MLLERAARTRRMSLPDHGFNDVIDLVHDLLIPIRQYVRLQDDIDLGHAAFDFVHHRHYRRFCHLGNRQARRLDFLCAQAVPGYVDYVIHASQDPEIAVHGQHGSVRREIRPVMPVLAVAILAVFSVILLDEARAITPNGLHDPWPGIANADVPCLPRTGGHILSHFVDDGGVDARHPWARASRLHRIQGRLGAAEEASVFGLPPCVHNHCLTFANRFVIPAPNLWLDGFSHRGHVLEMIFVLGGFIVTGFAQHTDGRGRGVEDVDIQALGDSPYPAGVGVGRDTFVDDAGGGQGQRSINNKRVAGNPADVGHAPVHIFGVDVLDVFGAARHISEIAASAVLTAFWLSS